MGFCARYREKRLPLQPPPASNSPGTRGPLPGLSAPRSLPPRGLCGCRPLVLDDGLPRFVHPRTFQLSPLRALRKASPTALTSKPPRCALGDTVPSAVGPNGRFCSVIVCHHPVSSVLARGVSGLAQHGTRGCYPRPWLSGAQTVNTRLLNE